MKLQLIILFLFNYSLAQAGSLMPKKERKIANKRFIKISEPRSAHTIFAIELNDCDGIAKTPKFKNLMDRVPFRYECSHVGDLIVLGLFIETKEIINLSFIDDRFMNILLPISNGRKIKITYE